MINAANTEAASCNLNIKAEYGQLVYFMEGSRKILCRITFLQSTPVSGTSGRLVYLDTPRRPPRMGTELFLQPSNGDHGVYVPVGLDVWDKPVAFRLNAMFGNVLVAGKTQSGKTHLTIVMAEELIRLQVPHLILDSEDECLGLQEKFPDQVVLASKDPKIIDRLQQRKTVIVSLMGMTPRDKTDLVNTIITKLKFQKEQSYKKNKYRYPPMLITLDEAEIYAPGNHSTSVSPSCRKTIEDLVKRGVKFGLGTMLLSQRPKMLDIDVRTQCNSGVFFLLDDESSLNTIRNLGYVTKFDTDSIRRLQRGEAFATGPITLGPVKLRVRDIAVKRTKSVDFENLLYSENNGQALQ